MMIVLAVVTKTRCASERSAAMSVFHAAQGLLTDAKENTAKLAQKMDDFDAAQKRFLGHKCGLQRLLILY